MLTPNRRDDDTGQRILNFLKAIKGNSSKIVIGLNRRNCSDLVLRIQKKSTKIIRVFPPNLVTGPSTGLKL